MRMCHCLQACVRDYIGCLSAYVYVCACLLACVCVCLLLWFLQSKHTTTEPKKKTKKEAVKKKKNWHTLKNTSFNVFHTRYLS